jgi:hypothetical protein
MEAEEAAAMQAQEDAARRRLAQAQAEVEAAERAQELAMRAAARRAELERLASRITIPTWAWLLIGVGGIGATFGVVTWLAQRKG